MAEGMTDQELRGIRERADRATPGPWRLGYGCRTEVFQADEKRHEDGRTHVTYCGLDTNARHAADAVFIAAARTDVPSLVAEVERLRVERLALAKLAAETPQFFNPLEAFAAQKIRDDVLAERATLAATTTQRESAGGE